MDEGREEGREEKKGGRKERREGANKQTYEHINWWMDSCFV